jgi:hypothetical protein
MSLKKTVSRRDATLEGADSQVLQPVGLSHCTFVMFKRRLVQKQTFGSFF